MLFQVYPRVINSLTDWNPQLFREIKGRLTSKNVTIVSFVSILGQFLFYLYFNALLPATKTSYSRYCTGQVEYQYALCKNDLLGNVQILKDLWWLDLFTTMSIIGIFILIILMVAIC